MQNDSQRLVAWDESPLYLGSKTSSGGQRGMHSLHTMLWACRLLRDPE